MWIKCKDGLPNKNGTYMTAECGFMGHTIYRIAQFNKNLGSVFGLEEHEGKSGFYDYDSEWGNCFIEPEAWKYIEKYRG